MFDNEGPKAGPKSTPCIHQPSRYTPPSNIINTLTTALGLKNQTNSYTGLGDLINAFALGYGGAKFVEEGCQKIQRRKSET